MDVKDWPHFAASAGKFALADLVKDFGYATRCWDGGRAANQQTLIRTCFVPRLFEALKTAVTAVAL
jgi:hypothetical protein